MSQPYPLRLTDAAEDDLAEIWSYIAADASEEVATRLLGTLHARLERLRNVPFSGAPRPQLGPGLRVALQGKYALYYRAGDSEIVVIRVLHGARDHAAMADKGEFPDE